MPSISVVIPNYNRQDSILPLLEDIYRQEGVDIEVIVVDDGSSDGSCEAIARQFPQTILLRNEQNGGPCVSRNRGIRAARNEIVVGFDSDVSLPSDTLLHGISKAFADCPEVSAIALRILAADGKSEDGPRWCHPRPMAQYAHQAFVTDYISGTGYAFRREPALLSGLFPELFYMHHEEVEISFRILDTGGRIMHCPWLAVLHHPHPVANRSKNETYYNPRNQVLLAVGMFPWPKAVSYLVPRMIYQFLSAVVGKRTRVFLSAMQDAWRLLPRRLEERKPLHPATLALIARIRRSREVIARSEYSVGHGRSEEFDMLTHP